MAPLTAQIEELSFSKGGDGIAGWKVLCFAFTRLSSGLSSFYVKQEDDQPNLYYVCRMKETAEILAIAIPGCRQHQPGAAARQAAPHRHGAYVTFVNTEHNHRRVQETEGAGAVRGQEGFSFEAIPDGLSDADRDSKQDYGRSIAMSTSTRCAVPFKDLIMRLNSKPGVPLVTCVLPTMMMRFALRVAQELGIPTMVLWTASAASLMTHMKLRELQDVEL
ncbi:hypothetical protein HU200_013860 [Digitaria exilis]|uniref:Uncharacterized protein n=1 Tax=Digitaria exilis TaxID=1010633 RepID=A0A835KJA3_9POAL|nr:hypothetical protein HU200_013860 [Digitaria exilis]